MNPETLDIQPANEPSAEKPKSSWGEIIRFALITTTIVLPIRIFIAQPFIVSGASMDPTFESGQYLIVDEVSYRFEEPQRGDIVIFKHPGPNEEGRILIKRIIGLPEETLEIEGNGIIVKNKERPEGFELDQSYVKNKVAERKLIVYLEGGEYFVMGDNRPVSSDSRSWGAIGKSSIIGRPIIRLFPLSKIELFPGIAEDAKESPVKSPSP